MFPNQNLHLDQPQSWQCQPILDNVTHLTDCPTATRLGLWSSLVPRISPQASYNDSAPCRQSETEQLQVLVSSLSRRNIWLSHERDTALQWCYMSIMPSQITGNSTDCSTTCSSKQQRRHNFTLHNGESTEITSGFPSIRADNVDKVSSSHHGN